MTTSEVPAHRHPPRLEALAAAGAAGLAIGLLGLGVGELVAATSARLRSPIFDVGDRVVDHVPVWLKDLAISWFGTNDKRALLTGTFAAVAVMAMVIGMVGLLGQLRCGLLGVGLFGLVGALAALDSRTGVDGWTALPSVVGATVGGAALWGLSRVWPQYGHSADRAPGGERAGRRAFVMGVVAVAGAGAVTLMVGRRLASRFDVSASRAALRLPTPDRPASPLPHGAQVPGGAPFFTTNADFYRIDTALAVPQVRPDSWELTIKGLVDRELRLSFDDLIRRTIVESDITLTCVSNTIGGSLIGTARWTGVRLDELLAEAGVKPAADQIVGRSVDGYTCGFPVVALDGRDALVAIAMNGEPLPVEHGFPARLIVPGIYGYASATKWLTEIELTKFADFDHYWVPRGYAAQAPIKMQSRIDRPRGLDRIPAGPFVIGGVAWAQPVGVDAVEVQVDDGEWVPAEVGTEVDRSTWRQWYLPWDAAPGRHTIAVRAIDHNGAIQTADRSEPFPNGATGHHTVVVLVDEA